MWREKCCESTFTQIPRFSLLSDLQTQQSFSQTSLNSSIIRIQTQKHNFKINQIINKKKQKKRKKKKDRRQKPSDPFGLRWGRR